MLLQKNINYLYKNMSFFMMYKLDIFISIFVILIVVLITLYFFLKK